MPAKTLTSPLDRDESQKLFKFGGGANTITALDHDASFGYWINAGGGDDTITGADFAAGTTADDLIGVQVYSDDTLIGGTGSDTISGGLGDDLIYGGKEDGSEKFSKKNGASRNELYGEEIAVTVSAPGFVAGSDTITGGDGATNIMYGDYFIVNVITTGTFKGGDDTMAGGDGTADFVAINDMFGDASGAFVAAGLTFTGGDDKIIGGDNADNLLVGDAQSISGDGSYVGGADVLIGGDNAINVFYGDWVSGGAIATAVGGDDMLTGGVNATNTFVFVENNGYDTITNFNLATDVVDLSDFGFAGFGDLTGLWTNVGGSAELNLDGSIDGTGDVIVFNGFADETQFTAANFDFV